MTEAPSLTDKAADRLEQALATLVRSVELRLAQAQAENEALRSDVKASEAIIQREKAKAQAIQEELNKVHDEHAAITGTYEAELERLRDMLAKPDPQAEARLGPVVRAELMRRLEGAITTVERLIEAPPVLGENR